MEQKVFVVEEQPVTQRDIAVIAIGVMIVAPFVITAVTAGCSAVVTGAWNLAERVIAKKSEAKKKER